MGYSENNGNELVWFKGAVSKHEEHKDDLGKFLFML